MAAMVDKMGAAEAPKVVRCRPSGSLWAVALVFAGMAIGIVALDQASPHPAAGVNFVWMMVLAGILFIPAVIGVIWLVRSVVIADDNGLRWRGLHGWRFAAWDEVTDYYDNVIQGTSKKAFVVETAAGHVVRSAGSWTKIDYLRRVVQSNATGARAKSVQTLGSRGDVDLPRTFDYRNANTAMMRWIIPALWVALCALMVERSFALYGGYTKYGWSSGVSTLAWKVALHIAVNGVLIGLFTFIWRSTKRRLNQRITANRDGLLFEDGAASQFMSWDEVTSYAIISDPAVRLVDTPVNAVMSARHRIMFDRNLNDAAALAEIIARNAVNAATKRWRTDTDDAFGGIAARWTGGCEGMGDRVYHYRNRSGRVMLVWSPLGLAVIALVPALARIQLGPSPASPADIIFVAVFTTVIVLGAFWFCAVYRTASIRTGDRGITQQTPLGSRFIAWDDIKGYRPDPWQQHGFVVIGSRVKIRFGELITDIGELKDEIPRRAINSRNKTWESDVSK
jgi:hypothetical protein